MNARGDPKAGAAIFDELCSQCHRLRGKGSELGPDLEGVFNWGAERILRNIIDPNAEINPQYKGYAIETKDGRFLAGVLQSETAGSVTLKQNGGLLDTVLRVEIADMMETGISLMPEGLFDERTNQDIADLVAFITAPE